MTHKAIPPTAQGIEVARLVVLRHRLKLEIAQRAGLTVTTAIKREFGFKGSRKAVLSQLSALIKARRQS
jgi:hypothetical protein